MFFLSLIIIELRLTSKNYIHFLSLMMPLNSFIPVCSDNIFLRSVFLNLLLMIIDFRLNVINCPFEKRYLLRLIRPDIKSLTLRHSRF